MEQKLYLNAYYYSFEPTGILEIDKILEAVAQAGKSYHNTDMWNEPSDYGDKKSCEERIQDAANDAAQKLVTSDSQRHKSA